MRERTLGNEVRLRQAPPVALMGSACHATRYAHSPGVRLRTPRGPSQRWLSPAWEPKVRPVSRSLPYPPPTALQAAWLCSVGVPRETTPL
jgi:hypothetical protein